MASWWRGASASWIVGIAALAVAGLVDAAQLAAQSHAPKPAAAPHSASPPQAKGEHAAPTHAKDDHPAPTRDNSGHAASAHDDSGHTPPAKPTVAKAPPPRPSPAASAAGGHHQAESRAPAASTVHADDDADRASGPATRRPAAPAAPAPGNKELDAVMQRINSRISATTGKPVVAPARPHAAPTAAASAPAKPTRGSSAHAAAHDAPGGHGEADVATRPASSPARVSVTWRPSVVWPRAVLDGGDSRVDVDWTPAVR